MFNRIYVRLTSLNLGLWLIALVTILLAIGSFTPGASEQSGINDLPLLLWLREAPFLFSWWLWLCVVLLAVLCLNTVLCTIEALRRKGRNLAPHLMHVGFLCIVIAHLFSAYGGFKQALEIHEGGTIGFPDGEMVRIDRLTFVPGPMGMPVAYGAQLRLGNGEQHGVRPNEPLFHKGYGIYLKQVGMDPAPVALVEIHREPGAIPALIGAILFIVGNVMLLRTRRGKV